MCKFIKCSKQGQRYTSLRISIQIWKGCICKRIMTILYVVEQLKADKAKRKNLGNQSTN